MLKQRSVVVAGAPFGERREGRAEWGDPADDATDPAPVPRRGRQAWLRPGESATTLARAL